MEIATEAGTSVAEQTLRLEDLYSADEVFITSTNRNVIGGEGDRRAYDCGWKHAER